MQHSAVKAVIKKIGKPKAAPYIHLEPSSIFWVSFQTQHGKPTANVDHAHWLEIRSWLERKTCGVGTRRKRRRNQYSQLLSKPWCFCWCLSMVKSSAAYTASKHLAHFRCFFLSTWLFSKYPSIIASFVIILEERKNNQLYFYQANNAEIHRLELLETELFVTMEPVNSEKSVK